MQRKRKKKILSVTWRFGGQQYQSSAVNFDQTAQLVTDGIVHDIANEDKMAYSVSNPYDNEARYGNPKELFDDDNSTRWISYHTSSWAQIQVPFSQKKVIKSYTLTAMM